VAAEARADDDREAAFEAVQRRVRRRRRWRLGLAIAAVMGVAALVATTILPPWLIGQSRDAYTSCVNGFVVRGDGEPAACLEAARPWLALPRVLPWHHDAAKATETAFGYDAAELTLAQATSRAPDAARRDAAVAAMADFVGGPLPPASVDGFLIELHTAGALEALIERGAGARDAGALRLALRAAILFGRVEAADAIARRQEERDWEHGLARGAWLCLRGHHREGLEALLAADALYRARVRDEPWGAVRMALLACHPSESDPSLLEVAEIDATAMLSAAMHFRPEEVDVEARLALHLVNQSAIEEAYRSPFVAYAVTRRERDLGALIALVDPLGLALPRHGLRLLPFSSQAPQTGPFAPTPLLLDPALHARAAAALARAAEGATPLPPLDPVIDEPIWERQRRERIDRARKEPAKHLRAAAWTLYLEAAMAWVDRGDPRAREALVAAGSLARDPDDAALLAAPLHIALGEPARAAELIEAGLAEPDDAFSTTLMQANLALALADQGEQARAFAAAKGAVDGAARLDRASAARASLVAAMDWLVAAMAIRSGQPEAMPPIEAPSRQERLAWGALIALSESERAAHRWRMPPAGTESEILPALALVVGAAAEPSDREVWLDRMLPLPAREPLRRYALARTTAARWRGDGAADAIWTARWRAMVELIVDPRTDLLARLAGI
jgi:hypothetical protein